MNIIEQLKQNTSAFALMPLTMRDIMDRIGTTDFLFLNIEGDFVQKFEAGFSPSMVYRLRSDYVCTHSVTNKHAYESGALSSQPRPAETCAWCDEPIKEEKKTWILHEVILCDDGEHARYQVRIGRLDIDLMGCYGMAGFDGVKYKTCSCVKHPETSWGMLPPSCEKHGPYVPEFVRFWVRK